MINYRLKNTYEDHAKRFDILPVPEIDGYVIRTSFNISVNDMKIMGYVGDGNSLYQNHDFHAFKNAIRAPRKNIVVMSIENIYLWMDLIAKELGIHQTIDRDFIQSWCQRKGVVPLHNETILGRIAIYICLKMGLILDNVPVMVDDKDVFVLSADSNRVSIKKVAYDDGIRIGINPFFFLPNTAIPHK